MSEEDYLIREQQYAKPEPKNQIQNLTQKEQKTVTVLHAKSRGQPKVRPRHSLEHL